MASRGNACILTGCQEGSEIAGESGGNPVREQNDYVESSLMIEILKLLVRRLQSR